MNAKLIINSLIAAISLILMENTYSASNDTFSHDVDLTLRSRYAFLKETNANLDNELRERSSKAISVLARMSLHSHWNPTFSTLLEIDHVETFLKEHHSDGVRLNGRPIIVDVPTTEVNQASINIDVDQFLIKLGRQRIEIDDERFIGSIDFWQNDQTYDGLSLKMDFLSSSSLNYGYIINSNRIFGNTAGKLLNQSDVLYGPGSTNRPLELLGDHEHNSHYLHINMNEWDYSQLKFLAYAIDSKDVPAESGHTVGMGYTYDRKINNIKYHLELDYAIQKHKESTSKPIVPYYRAELGAGFNSFEVSARYEVVDSKENRSFSTPFGSMHEFFGWADAFAIFPNTGVDDRSLRFHWRKSPWKLDVRFHQFHSASTGAHYGNEIDIDVIFKLNKKHRIFVRYADFQAAGSNWDDIKVLREAQIQSKDVRRIYFTYSYSI